MYKLSSNSSQIDKLILKANKLSDQLLQGNQASLFKGRGMNFNEVRKYQIGDDIRTMHWGVTARLQEPHIKLYSEEKNLTLWLLVDISGSGLFGTSKRSKFETIVEICAILSFAAQKSNCNMGCVFFSDRIEKVFSPLKGKSQCFRILHFLEALHIMDKRTKMQVAIDYILRIARKGSLVVILSDFMDESFSTNLKLLSAKHDLLGIRIHDRSEKTFPLASHLRSKDPETGKIDWINTSAKNFQKQYIDAFERRTSFFKSAFHQAGAGSIDFSTDEIIIDKLKLYFNKK